MAIMGACANPKFQETDSENDPLETDSQSLDEKTEEDIKDLIDDIDSDYCLEFEDYQDVPGATSFYYGAFMRDGDAWVGREKWLLFATPAWVENGGYDCQVTWDINATESPQTNCLACDFSLQLSASINRSETNCPEGLWNYDEQLSWSEIYEVDISDTQASFYFQTSGNYIGSGQATSNSMDYISEPDCKWF